MKYILIFTAALQGKNLIIVVISKVTRSMPSFFSKFNSNHS